MSASAAVHDRKRSDYDHLLKVILVGDESTGKSSIMSRHCDNVFNFTYTSTIGVDFKIRTQEADVDGVPTVVKMQMWDTAGQERFSSITKSFYRGADAVVVVYDVTCPDTFRHTKKWLKAATECCDDNLITCLVGNKVDLGGHRVQRLVSTEEGEARAMEHGMLFYETSAKDAINIDTVFGAITQAFVKQQRRLGFEGRKRTATAATNVRRIRRDDEVTGDAGSCWGRLLRMFSTKRSTPAVPAVTRTMHTFTPAFAH